MGAESQCSSLRRLFSYRTYFYNDRMRVGILTLLLGCALGATVDRPRRQLFDFGRTTNIQASFNSPSTGYLTPDIDNSGAEDCPRSTVVRTETRYSTVVVPSTVYNNRVQTIYRTSISNLVVPTTIVEQVVRTQVVPQVRYSTRVVTRTQENVRTNYVTLPAQVNTVYLTSTALRTDTRYETRYTTRVQQVPTTVFRQVTTTQVVPRNVVSTITRTNVVTQTRQIPGVTRTVDRTQYTTVTSTVQVPAQNVVRTQTVVSTNFRERTITAPGVTQVVTSTVLQRVFTTLYSTQVQVNTQTQFVTSTQQRQVVSTVNSIRYNTQISTRFVTVPQQVIQTRVQTQFVPTTVYRTQTVQSLVNLPAQTRYSTQYTTVVRTQFIPGNVETRVNTRFVTNTNFVTSTVVNRQVSTVYSTRTIQQTCGYNYDAPKTPFNF